MKTLLNLVIIVLLLAGCKKNKVSQDLKILDSNMIENKASKVTLKNTDGKYELLVNNTPFYIKGAGLEFGEIAALAKHNGNSFRTWRTEDGERSGKEILDEAHKNGLMVTMGIEVAI